MLNYNMVDMRYEPYPLAVLRPALEASHYDQLASSFPDESLFGKLTKFPYKLSLSEKWASENYHRFLRDTKVWQDFHAFVKSDDFIFKTFEFLKHNHVELPLSEAFESGSQKMKRLARSIGKGRMPSRGMKLSSRFEFSSLRADGGMVEPHTDAASKVITLVFTMIKEGEWDPAFGGGLDMNITRDRRYSYNWANKVVPWEGLEVVETVPFLPNQCTVFVKTHNSLHSVRKMTQTGSKALRKSVTVVIERDD